MRIKTCYLSVTGSTILKSFPPLVEFEESKVIFAVFRSIIYSVIAASLIVIGLVFATDEWTTILPVFSAVFTMFTFKAVFDIARRKSRLTETKAMVIRSRNELREALSEYWIQLNKPNYLLLGSSNVSANIETWLPLQWWNESIVVSAVSSDVQKLDFTLDVYGTDNISDMTKDTILIDMKSFMKG